MIFLVLIEERRLEDNHGLIFSFLSLLVADLRVARLFTTPVKELMNCSKCLWIVDLNEDKDAFKV